MGVYKPSKSGDAMGEHVFTRFSRQQRRDYAEKKQKENDEKFDLNDRDAKKFREISRKQMQDLKNYQKQGLI